MSLSMLPQPPSSRVSDIRQKRSMSIQPLIARCDLETATPPWRPCPLDRTRHRVSLAASQHGATEAPSPRWGPALS
eukprot:4913924-Pyramimonas_sp.AAC.1